MGCMVPEPFATRGNRSYLEYWAITDNPWYLGYFTQTVASESSIERVAGDCGAKPLMILTGNPTVVATV
jgi:hypothetical protein